MPNSKIFGKEDATIKITIPVDRPLKIGYVLATHASAAYVELGCLCLVKNDPNVRILVHDDGSLAGDRLKEIASKYGADFVATEYRKVATVGDLSAFAEGLSWGKRLGLDLVVKASRRFVIDHAWSETLARTAQNVQYATYSGPDATFGFGFRSECVAMHVESWIASGVHAEMSELVRRNQPYTSLPEAHIHNWARQVHAHAHRPNAEVSHFNEVSHPECDFVVKSEISYPRPATCDGYFWWSDVLGLARSQKIEDQLWHDANSWPDYLALSERYGLSYTQRDFNLEFGAGDGDGTATA